jgi:glycerol-3-phosphate acyltransferase PlsY
LTSYLISIIIGYLIGSFPSSFLFVRLKSQKDIRNEGSGMAGTMNAFEVSNSKLVGIAVLVCDVLKGLLAVIIVKLFLGNEFWLQATAGIFSIFGHDYPVWLKFKGGRGLATTAGVMLIFGWIFIVVWLIWFAIIYLLSKNIHLGNIVATVLSPVIIWIIPDNILHKLLPMYSSPNDYILLSFIVCVLILIRHADTIKESFKLKKG